MARIIDGKNMNMIGSRLRTLRVERGWSQQTLSDKLEVLAIYICRGSVSRIEDKRRTVTDIELYGLWGCLLKAYLRTCQMSKAKGAAENSAAPFYSNSLNFSALLSSGCSNT